MWTITSRAGDRSTLRMPSSRPRRWAASSKRASAERRGLNSSPIPSSALSSGVGGCGEGGACVIMRILSNTRYDRSVGRSLILIGVILVALGALITLGDRLPIKLGRLPGDIVIRGKNSTFYFPIVTSLLVSIVLSLVLWLVRRR